MKCRWDVSCVRDGQDMGRVEVNGVSGDEPKVLLTANELRSAARTRAGTGHLVSGPFKEVVHPSAGVWMHLLELDDVAQVDAEVVGWLAEAYAAAG